MTVYKSSHKGSQIDEAVTIAVGNKNKGNANLPIYYDANGVAQPISVDNAATANSNKLLTGGGMYNGLTPKLSNSEIQTTVNTSGLPPSQGAAKKYTDTQVGTLQDPLISSDTINVGSDGKISVTDGVLRRGTSKLDEKVDHFAEYGIGNDSTVLSEMDEVAHSTFDASKFTKVGNPTITSDGVASGFVSSTNFINATYTSTTPTSSIDIWTKVIITNTTETSGVYCAIDGNLRLVRSTANAIGIRGFSGNLACDVGNLSLVLNDEVVIHANVTGAGATLDVWVNGTKKSNSVTRINTIGIEYSHLVVGGQYSNGNYSPSNSVDLKYTSITVDGVPVFSGNKTGIDTVKPDDYTVVGSLTITSDGVASGFSASNYLTFTGINLANATSFDIYGDFTTSSTLSTDGDGNILKSNSLGIILRTYLSNLQLVISDNGTSANVTSQNVATGLTANTHYYYHLKYDGVYRFYLRIEDIDWNLKYTSSSAGIAAGLTSSNIWYLGSIANSAYFKGSIDLNTFKIYVDGNLVYQPCLKIPYTLTKDGKKIVDNVYRSRVEDEYGQAGYTPYYTLQQELGDNYTVVGSPTISADGIASGFSSSNEIYIPVSNISSSSNLDIVAEVKTGNSVTSNGILYLRETFQIDFGLDISSQNKLVIRYWNGSTVTYKTTDYTINANTEYIFRQNYNNGTISVYVNDIFVDSVSNGSITTPNALYIGESNLGGGTKEYFTGSIDLNAFKIYVDNKLVYTAGRNYTLPTVEEEDIISSAENDVSMYTQRANLALEQTGSCTANTAYTFPKPFMNADYSLSIPYTSGTKTATGFTPAESGEYIAEGLGKLY